MPTVPPSWQACPKKPAPAGTIQLGGKGWRRGFFRKTRRERGAGRWKARNERTTKLLRKKTQPARPIELNRSGSAGTIQLGGKGWRGGFFRKTRRERGAGRLKARNERTTKLLRKKTQPARPIPSHRSGWPERFSWEERDGVADSFAKRGESEARADGRPVTSEQRSSCGRRRSQHDRSN